MLITDQDIWKKLRAGDRQALAQLFERYYDDCYQYAIRLQQPTAVVQDHLQDVFLHLWHKRKRLPQVISVKAYLLRSLRNQIIDGIRQAQRHQQVEMPEMHVFSAEVDWIKREQVQQKTEALIEALQQLSPVQREVIFLRFYQQLSYQEISDTLDIEYQSVRNAVHRAIKRLRNLMVQH